MNIIVCLDNNNGMMFNKRRQSQDKILRDNIKNLIKDNILYMNEYSYTLYKDIDCHNIKVCEDFLDKCKNDDFCLIENVNVFSYLNKINTIIIYKWNRDYPSDFKFDINLKNENFSLINTNDFKGNSHNKITKQVYRRNKNE